MLQTQEVQLGCTIGRYVPQAEKITPQQEYTWRRSPLQKNQRVKTQKTY